jgi:hypothetical protein
MGEVVNFHGVTIRVNPRDHNPPHVHIVGKGGHARFNIKVMKWMDSEGFSRSDLRAIREVIERRIEECWEEWRRIHG